MAEGQGQKGISRRHLLRNSILAGAAAAGATTAAGILRWLTISGKPAGLVEGFVYTQPLTASAVSYQDLVGQEAVPYHFTQTGQAATTMWRALRDQLGTIIPGTGSAALLMRLDPARIILPPDLQERVTAGGLVALFNTCTHLCCNSGSHLINAGGTNMVSPPPAEDVLAHPNSTTSGLPVVAPDIGVIDCPCHYAQFDPFRFVWANHPNGVRYLGANWVWGPGGGGYPSSPSRYRGPQ